MNNMQTLNQFHSIYKEDSMQIFHLLKDICYQALYILLIDDLVTEITNLIAIKLYNSFNSLSLTFLF